jgi:hypothetical protein
VTYAACRYFFRVRVGGGGAVLSRTTSTAAQPTNSLAGGSFTATVLLNWVETGAAPDRSSRR